MRRGLRTAQLLCAALAVFSCAESVRPARAPCVAACFQDKDRCVLEAQTGEEIERCDQSESRCHATCY